MAGSSTFCALLCWTMRWSQRLVHSVSAALRWKMAHGVCEAWFARVQSSDSGVHTSRSQVLPHARWNSLPFFCKQSQRCCALTRAQHLQTSMHASCSSSSIIQKKEGQASAQPPTTLRAEQHHSACSSPKHARHPPQCMCAHAAACAHQRVFIEQRKHVLSATQNVFFWKRTITC